MPAARTTFLLAGPSGPLTDGVEQMQTNDGTAAGPEPTGSPAGGGSAPATVAWRGAEDPHAPLVVLLHGRGSNEADIIGLADVLPVGPAYAAVRAPIGEGGGFAWFANRGIGRPVAESLADTMAWFRAWLDPIAPPGRPVVLVGFSGGAAFAGGLALDDPGRFAGAAVLYGTVPFDAGVPTTPDRLVGLAVLVVQGEQDTVIPRELLDRTWEYLTGDAGATVDSLRHDGGHGISPEGLDELRRWITRLTDDTVT